MELRDLQARRRRLRQLSTGFQAEIVSLATGNPTLPAVQAKVYRAAIIEAQLAVDRARTALAEAEAILNPPSR